MIFLQHVPDRKLKLLYKEYRRTKKENWIPVLEHELLERGYGVTLYKKLINIIKL